jgi:NADH:ubiquinone oxidoreductase subunit 2 (subunit N)
VTNRWLIAWICIETNNLSFTIIKINKNTTREEKEGMLKYFLVQAISSASFILLQVINIQLRWNTIKAGAMIIIIVKIAAAPLHSWFIEVVKKIALPSALLAMTWQKLIPLIITINNTCVIIKAFLVRTAVIGTVEITKTKKPKGIIVRSSIFNNRWIIARATVGIKPMSYISAVYWIAVYQTMGLVWSEDSSFMKKSMITTTIFCNLGGLPPLPIFWTKLIIVNFIIKINEKITTSILMLLSVINIYVYLTSINKSIFSLRTLYSKSWKKW